jgi:hypothetical protein
MYYCVHCDTFITRILFLSLSFILRVSQIIFCISFFLLGLDLRRFSIEQCYNPLKIYRNNEFGEPSLEPCSCLSLFHSKASCPVSSLLEVFFESSNLLCKSFPIKILGILPFLITFLKAFFLLPFLTLLLSSTFSLVFIFSCL